MTGITKFDGGVLKLSFEDVSFKAKYFDEHTGEELPHRLVVEAMIEELSYSTARRCGKLNHAEPLLSLRVVLVSE